MSNVLSQKRSTKGPLFREDDRTLPEYLYLLVYGQSCHCILFSVAPQVRVEPQLIGTPLGKDFRLCNIT